MSSEFRFCGIKLFDYENHDDNFGCTDFYNLIWETETMKIYNDNKYICRIWTDGDVEIFEKDTESFVETYKMLDLVK